MLEPSIHDIGFDLRSPCADCPFVRGVAFHEGVCHELPSIIQRWEKSEMAHTCHKTDPRSDGFDQKNAGKPIQHCAGMLIMAEKSEMPQLPMNYAVAMKKYRPQNLNMQANVFDSMKEMAAHYLGLREEVLPGPEGRLLHVHLRNEEGY